MVPSDLHLPDGLPLAHHAHPAGSTHPSPAGGFGGFGLPLADDPPPSLAPPTNAFLPSHPPAPLNGQLYPSSGSIAGQQAPVARHLGIRLEAAATGEDEGAASGGLSGRGAGGGGGGSRGHGQVQGAGMQDGMGMGQAYAGGMNGRQQYQPPYAPIASTSSGTGHYHPGPPPQPYSMAYSSGNYPPPPHPHHSQASPIHSPILQSQQYHNQYQQPYAPYSQVPHPAQVSLAPAYAPPMMDSQMYAQPPAGPGPGQLVHSQSQGQLHSQQQHQQSMPYPIAPAFATQGGTFYFMPRQQPNPQPLQPQYPTLPPPLMPGPGAGIYDLPHNGLGHGPGAGRTPMLASGMAMSLPLSATSSSSSLAQPANATATLKRPTPTPDPNSPNSSAPAPANARPTPATKPKKKKARSAKDQPKRFLCDFAGCGRAFARQFNLQTHAKSHFNIRDYDCAHCDKKFSRRHDRGRHCAAVHPEAVNEDLGGRGGRGEEGEGEGEEEGSGEEYPDVRGLGMV